MIENKEDNISNIQGSNIILFQQQRIELDSSNIPLEAKVILRNICKPTRYMFE